MTENQAMLGGITVIISFIVILELIVIRVYFGTKINIFGRIKRALKRVKK